MSYGFSAENNSGEILVSDQTLNLHFWGKATLASQNYASYCGGRYVYTFTINCVATPVPFFTMPTDGNSYGVTRVYGSSGNWSIEVIHGVVAGLGISAPTGTPEVYVFCSLEGFPEPTVLVNSVSVNDNFGLVVYGAGGPAATAVFDSRHKPLVVTGGLASVSPPSAPFANGLPSGEGGLSARYCSANEQGYFLPGNTYNTAIASAAAKPIYAFSAMGQCEREFTLTNEESHEYYWSCGGFLGLECTYHPSRTVYHASKYWAFYRGAISRISGQLRTTWAVANYGCGYQAVENSFDPIKQASNSTGDWTGGIWPYANKTLNIDAAPLLMSDAALYD